MFEALRGLARRLPDRWQQEVKRHYFARQIRLGAFRTTEPEYDLLEGLVCAGDWVLDIGANVGHYTCKLSALVGSECRVLAFEPIPQTFELLSANSLLFPFRNVTLFNTAVSDRPKAAPMVVPPSGNGRPNFYQAQLVDGQAALTGDHYCVFACSVDSLDIPHRVSLVKIDTEGHELAAIKGMLQLLARDHPVLIVEGEQATPFLKALNYVGERIGRSPNTVYHPGGER